ncbi:MAG TPA: hypothetical protein VNU68_08890 [Verrucomicrobiae bacterium]|nr:hypothetical protein [Verrucomicrobiae bacterium]
MSTRRRRLRWWAAITLVVGLASVGLFWRNAPPQTHGLPDGSELELNTVTYGRSYRMPLGDGLRDQVGRVLPASWARKFGCQYIRAGESNMVTVWLVWRNFPVNASLRAATFDTHGCELGLTPVAQYQRVNPREALVVGQFEVFPRRDEKLGVRFYEQQTNGPWIAVAEFSVRNPGRRAFPRWQPEPLPITKSAGAVECTLLEMKAGVLRYSFPPQPGKPGEPLGTYLRLRLTEQGRPTTDWQIAHVKELSDAMGHVIGPIGWSGIETPKSERVLVAAGALCWNEPAWKVGLEFFRVKHFPSNALSSVAGVPVPEDSSMSHFEISTNLLGVQLRLQGIVGKDCDKPKGRRVLSGSPVVHVRRLNLQPNHTLDLVRVIDRGKDVSIRGSGREAFDYFYAINPPKDATQLDLIFAIRETIEFEFQVAPTLAEPDQVNRLGR